MAIEVHGVLATPERVTASLAPRAEQEIARVTEAADREEIRSVLAEWALYRDTGRFDRLRALFAPGATIQTTWFDGTADEFVNRSEASFGGTVRAHHFIGPSSIDLHADRAIADTRIMLQLRAPVNGMLTDVACYGRFFDFFIKHDMAWRIRKRIPVYDKDRIDAVDHSKPLVIDPAWLAAYPAGCRHIAYVQALGGATVTEGLIEPGSAEEQRLYEEGSRWLMRD